MEPDPNRPLQRYGPQKPTRGCGYSWPKLVCEYEQQKEEPSVNKTGGNVVHLVDSLLPCPTCDFGRYCQVTEPSTCPSITMLQLRVAFPCI